MSISTRKVISAVRSESDFYVALNSKTDVIFLLNSDILSIKNKIDLAHKYNKKLFVHIDFLEGVGKDRKGLEYLSNLKLDGIITTKTSLIKVASSLGLITIQRFFIVDSHSIDTAIDSINMAKPDYIEVMPGIIEKKISEIEKKINVPIIAGGLIENTNQVDIGLASGAIAISTGKENLWDYK